MITWNYKRDFEAGPKARQRFKDKVIGIHDKFDGYECYLNCKDIKISPRKLLILMNYLGFKTLIISRQSKLDPLYIFKMYLLIQMKYNFKFYYPQNNLIEKWKTKGKIIHKNLDLEDACLEEIEKMKSELPFISTLEWQQLSKTKYLTRIKSYKKEIKIKPSEFKNVIFSEEADKTIDGPYYISSEDLLVISKNDYKKEELLIDGYFKLKKYPHLVLPKLKDSIVSKFVDVKFSNKKWKGQLENGIKFYCYNLPLEYYFNHLPHFNEFYYDSKEKCWKSSLKSKQSLWDLIRNVAEVGFKSPLCFTLSSEGQLIPLGCYTRIMIACYLKLPVIPAIILLLPDRNEKGDLNCKKLANKYLAPDLVFL